MMMISANIQIHIMLQHVTRAAPRSPPLLVLLALLVISSHSYEQIDSSDSLNAYHEEHSQYPIIHIYHNRHFSSSRQFQDFLQVLEDTQFRNRDYVKFVLSDCQKFKEGVTFACDDMLRTKDNRMIFGYYPAENFVNYGGKRMQNPPRSRQFNHPSDVYTVAELETFIDQIMPNFYQEIESLAQYEQFLEPKYAPKLLLATRDEEVPLVLKKLGVHFFLKFDLAFLSDLTESVVQKVKVPAFPSLLVLKYNYANKALEAVRYQQDISDGNYEKIKAFLEPYALQTPRNDLLFHRMKLQPDTGIIVSDNQAEVEEILDRASGWVIVSVVQGQAGKLKALRERYGRFFTYLHYLAGNETESLQLFDTEKKTMHEMPLGDIHFKALNKDEFLQTLGVWLKKNFVLIGVRQKYAHYCALSLATFFRGLTHCLIIQEDDYQQVSKALKMEFQQGFACYETSAKVDQKIVGRVLKGTYDDIYLATEYLTRMKSKQIVDDFVANPIKPIAGPDKLSQICNFPTKKCALLFTPGGKADRTAYDYLKAIAINFINEYQFYEIDLQCNQHFAQEIQILKKNTGGLLVYHPLKGYVALKAKLSKSTFEKFLQANLKDNKKLPFHQFEDQEVIAYACNNEKDTKESVAKNEKESSEEESL